MNRIISIIMVLILPVILFAQGTVSGTVTDVETGVALAGANVVVEGTSMGAAADVDGFYTIQNVPEGTYTITASVIGYTRVSQTVNVVGSVTLNFTLEASALELSALEVLASRATRNTPVAYSNIEKAELELRLGSQDVPMILNTTPSVYATLQGGGAGDARVNVRGFNQRNVAIMINGVPVNDMENGWVYWSNWDGIADATSSIQLQRGLSAVNLATPSIGGTMNIITDPAAHKWGGLFKQEYGTGTFLKSTFSFNTGLINDKLALSTTIVRKTGDGIIDKTWTDAWAYYFGASYALSNAHRFEFYALGAPQRHGQNRYKQNIGTYDEDFAKDLDTYNDSALVSVDPDDGEYIGQDPTFNQNWSPVTVDYNGKQYWYMYGAKTVDRYAKGYLNERENYFHKPQVNLNWYWTLNDKMRLSSVFYYSGGSGGGTGAYGTIVTADATGKNDQAATSADNWFKYYYGPSPWTRDWDATITINSAPADTVYVYKKTFIRGNKESIGILRNSINRQWTLGAISKLYVDMSEAIELQFGVDWRTAEIEHAREVRDLLGGDYFVHSKNEFKGEEQVKLGDIIDYHFTNTVDWLGFFGQGEYTADLFSAYGMFGISGAKYHHTNHFKKAENYTDISYIEASDKGEVVIDADWIWSFQTKGGGLYHLMDGIDVFANFGYVQKVPIVDQVIDDYNMALSTDPKNELFISTEGGINFRPLGGMLTGKLNFYYTMWRDRSMTRNVQTGAGTSGDTDIIFLTNLDQNHSGIEAEVAFQPTPLFRLDGALSYGMWQFVDDATGTYKEYATGQSYDYTYSVKDLKVGDMPQTIVALGASVFPVKDATIQAVLNWYNRHWADWDPISREVEDADGDGTISAAELEAADREQSWQAPGYMRIDLHAYYNLPIQLGGTKLQVYAHIFNALDALYIQDATDNSSYNAWDKDHDADDAEVYMGIPRSFNLGLTVRF